MTTHPYNVPLALSLIAGVLGNGRAQGQVVDDGPQHLNQISSIGESLRNARQRPLHILYVHGIGATGSADSHVFQKSLCAFLKGCEVPATPVPVARDYADRGEFVIGAEPPAFEYMGKPAWTSAEEWSASAPFVDHYVLRRSDGGPVVVDEINWWPLVFPLKCRNILTGEARLAGPNKTLLDLCSQAREVDPSNPGRFRTYPWITPQEAASLKSIHPRGALINRDLKNSLLDWGFSDAMMAAGSVHNLFREGMRQLFVKSARFNADGSRTNDWRQQAKAPDGVDREFIVVSHSLGSYLVFSTLNISTPGMDQSQSDAASADSANKNQEEDDAARYILERTSLVYFFANQVPLLELANMEVPKAAGLAPAETKPLPEAAGALSKRMMKWRDLRQNFGQRRSAAEVSAAKPPQVVAWSDPSDLLTWRVPGMDGLVIVNLYVRNTWWHWIIASPTAAHGNYAKNKNVLRIMLGP
jgi:hypothetical protein